MDIGRGVWREVSKGTRDPGRGVVRELPPRTDREMTRIRTIQEKRYKGSQERQQNLGDRQIIRTCLQDNECFVFLTTFKFAI